MMNLKWNDDSMVTAEEEKAIIELMGNVLPFGTEKESIQNDINNEYLTINKCRNGKSVVWYSDEKYNSAVYIDNLETLSEDEITKQLL